jgi:hypothetical protein
MLLLCHLPTGTTLNIEIFLSFTLLNEEKSRNYKDKTMNKDGMNMINISDGK